MIDIDSQIGYKLIYSLKNQGRHELALRKLFCENGRPRSLFNSDLNHFHYVVGDIYLAMKKPKEAISAFKKAIVHWPKDHQAAFAIAECYELLEKRKAALRWYANSLAIKFTADAAYNYGNILFDSGRYVESWLILRSIRSKDHTLVKQARKNAELARSRMSDRGH